jgi:hypothetical protein
MKILHFNCEHCHQVLEINAEDFKEESRNEEFIWGEMVECPKCKKMSECKKSIKISHPSESDNPINNLVPPIIAVPPSLKHVQNGRGWILFKSIINSILIPIFVLIAVVVAILWTATSVKQNPESSTQEDKVVQVSGACYQFKVTQRDSGYLMAEGVFKNTSEIALNGVTVQISFGEGNVKAYTGQDKIGYLSPGEEWRFQVICIRDNVYGAKIDGFAADFPLVGTKRINVKID